VLHPSQQVPRHLPTKLFHGALHDPREYDACRLHVHLLALFLALPLPRSGLHGRKRRRRVERHAWAHTGRERYFHSARRPWGISALKPVSGVTAKGGSVGEGDNAGLQWSSRRSQPHGEDRGRSGNPHQNTADSRLETLQPHSPRLRIRLVLPSA